MTRGGHIVPVMMGVFRADVALLDVPMATYGVTRVGYRGMDALNVAVSMHLVCTSVLVAVACRVGRRSCSRGHVFRKTATEGANEFFLTWGPQSV